MNAKFVAVILIFITNFRLCQSRRYDNFSLYSVVPTELDHLKFLQNLDKQKYVDMMFWKRPFKLHEEVQFIVNPLDEDLFRERVKHFRMNVILQMENIQAAFDSQLIQKYLRLQVNTYTWETYHTLDDIFQWLSDIALKYASLVELQTIGKSVEGRNIYAIEIKRPEAKGRVLVEGGVHGNEWISTEFVTYLTNQLIHANESNNSHFMNAAVLYQWCLIPVLNPDGYEYSQKEDRLWRKNRRNIGTGYGVDLNRNFDYSFGKHSTSTNPQDANYCGPTPFSEPETKAFAEYVMKKADNLKYFFSFHSYGQKLIIPYGDRVKHVDNYGEMENYGKQAILKMYKLNGVKYSVGTTYDTLGLRISGNSASWVKKNYNVKHVFTFLLRDNGSFGYALPPSQILPTCKEALAGLLEIVTAHPKKLRSHNMFSLSGQVCPCLNRILCHVLSLLFMNTLCIFSYFFLFNHLQKAALNICLVTFILIISM